VARVAHQLPFLRVSQVSKVPLSGGESIKSLPVDWSTAKDFENSILCVNA
jgi:hypothetical protein